MSSFGISQNAVGDCKILSKYFAYGYRGECKNGLASGKGEAKGKYWYIGEFKEGLPNGKGVIKYDANGIYISRFSSKLSGKIQYVDVSNPLKILVAYKDFSRILFFKYCIISFF